MSVVAVVPVKDLRETKSRLTPILDPAGRAGLTLYMMGRVVSALGNAEIEDVCVVSPDWLVLKKAREKGATALRQRSQGLNPALEEGRRWALDRGAGALLVMPADLPLLDAEDVRAVVSRGEEAPVVISPDATRDGTNALLLRPPDLLPFTFGPGSFEAHRKSAEASSILVEVCERPHLAFDLDTKKDLARFKAAEGLLP
ncbi:MAG: 2-phospho-L-lactate guanylyltransferase [Rubrobacteraceae bacterium]